MKNYLLSAVLFCCTIGLCHAQELKRVQCGNDKWGYKDKTGKLVIPCQYDFVSIFSEGLAPVQLHGKWGYIDKIGKMIIPRQYDDVRLFKEGLAKVQLHGKWGYIDKNNNWYKTKDDYAKGNYGSSSIFSIFAKKYVEEKINTWQKKGEFEKTTNYQQRVNETNRKAKADQLVKEAEQAFIAVESKTIPMGNMRLGEYDADNEVYLINNNNNQWLVPVPITEAQAFKAEWNNTKKTPKYFIENDHLALAGMVFTTPAGKSYTYSNEASLNYTATNIDYNFAPIEVDVTSIKTSTAAPTTGKQNISTVNVTVGNADIDTNIPVINRQNNKTFAVIIANENYQQESQVEFAGNDGAIFKEYCIKTLGLPAKNVHYVPNATLNNIRSEVRWISEVTKAYRSECSIIFYYAGHGIPDEKLQSAYLLPIDGTGSDAESGYKLDDLYATLGKLPTKNITILLDACFSGAKRDGSMLAAARGVGVKVKSSTPQGNTVVFSATQGDETAYPYKEKGHGMFTYFLLKKLQETKGNVTFGALSNYVTTNVKQQSIVINRKSQTPTVIPSHEMETAWDALKFGN